MRLLCNRRSFRLPLCTTGLSEGAASEGGGNRKSRPQCSNLRICRWGSICSCGCCRMRQRCWRRPDTILNWWKEHHNQKVDAPERDGSWLWRTLINESTGQCHMLCCYDRTQGKTAKRRNRRSAFQPLQGRHDRGRARSDSSPARTK